MRRCFRGSRQWQEGQQQRWLWASRGMVLGCQALPLQVLFLLLQRALLVRMVGSDK